MEDRNGLGAAELGDDEVRYDTRVVRGIPVEGEGPFVEPVLNLRSKPPRRARFRTLVSSEISAA